MNSSALALKLSPRRRNTGGPLESALRRFVGWETDTPLPTEHANFDSGAAGPPTVISWNASSSVRNSLARKGYTCQRRFCVLPSRARARWLLPITADVTRINGLKLYTPFSPAARLMKAIVTGIGDASWHSWAGQTVLVASRRPLPIESFLSPITNEKELTFSLSLGTPGTFQKLTIQVMRRDGKILGYLKMPMTDESQDRLCHEGAVLQKLAVFNALRTSIPDLLFSGTWNGAYVIFQSALEGTVGPLQFNEIHAKFLTDLEGCEPTLRPGESIVHDVARSWNQAASKLGAQWQELGREALKIAARQLNSSRVPCGIQHGDFAPWNMRVHRGKLFLFDWEYASWGTPILWDRFHFMAQTEGYLNKNPVPKNIPDLRDANRGLYLLYLLDSTARLSGETSDLRGINYRQKQLVRHIAALSSERVSRPNRDV
jgi:Phosphotransferase enzyme family